MKINIFHEKDFFFVLETAITARICACQGTSMFWLIIGVALFTIAKTWKQLKCPSIDNWFKKMWYIYTMEYYSAINKNEILPFVATWMD